MPSKPSLEKRIATLEKLVAEIRTRLDVNGATKKTDWRKSLEAFAGEPIIEEIIEEGRKIREAGRKRRAS
jgi:hypothetical protein